MTTMNQLTAAALAVAFVGAAAFPNGAAAQPRAAQPAPIVLAEAQTGVLSGAAYGFYPAASAGGVLGANALVSGIAVMMTDHQRAFSDKVLDRARADIAFKATALEPDFSTLSVNRK